MLVGATRHCATEATHAALLTELIRSLGRRDRPSTDTIQEHYSGDGGIPKSLVDLLVLSKFWKHACRASYRTTSTARPGLQGAATLEIIVKDEEAHSGQPGWVERCLATMPQDQVQRPTLNGGASIARCRGTCTVDLRALRPEETNSMSVETRQGVDWARFRAARGRHQAPRQSSPISRGVAREAGVRVVARRRR